MIRDWCKIITIQQRLISVAHPQANGYVEITNKTMSEGIKKRLEGSKGRSVEEIDTVLWAYRTSPLTATSETPFSLVYRNEAVIPAKIIFDFLRIETYKEESNAIAQKEELDAVELRREVA